eukprot:CAMPEP_0185620840 /NCGR_PEP_ID=MMETSP0436-20130131/55266_1 /TAXON_ID=626734 ORGANISM="Favella taraikaensis, Strain Fe Narragansett Bay" /NCGR_SAMPLE_ID=MMETSP0436 /ASSEMBLY_ACC=CAM_ASM_000390 /LENGTH=55 /DNA_ID=CAMNT_0028261543 /DNA_START=51 /DNA_END=215 /DNA_ORIENTATION=+
MPVMDGYESTIQILKTYQELVEQPGYSHLKRPIVFATTAHQNESTVNRCVQIGFN